MAKKVTCIFQDCLDCGDLAIWYALNTAYAKKRNVIVTPVHYQAIEAYGQMAKARKAGIKSYPFFTDGERYAKNIDGLFTKTEVETIEIPEKVVKLKRKGK